MALFQVSGLKSYAELREQILPARQTHLFDRTNHYNFGTKTQEFAVPLGVDVSLISPSFATKWKVCIVSGDPDATSVTRQTRGGSTSFTRLWSRSLLLQLQMMHSSYTLLWNNTHRHTHCTYTRDSTHWDLLFASILAFRVSRNLQPWWWCEYRPEPRDDHPGLQVQTWSHCGCGLQSLSRPLLG